MKQPQRGTGSKGGTFMKKNRCGKTADNLEVA
nr:MAG TPA_asm: hypothetical protein [Caudoviricetes sp.]